MAQPVWKLSVDVEAKTAKFQSGLSDAAKTARGAFQEINSGASAMGHGVGSNMFAARHSCMILAEEFGGHLPRALTAFVAELGPVGEALTAAFPFLAIVLGATLVIDHLHKVREAEEQLARDQTKFGTSVQNTFNSLDEKLLQTEIRADELRNDHLAALRHELQLINLQSLGELQQQFDTLAKDSDAVFNELTSHWYNFGHGSDDAKRSLAEFKAKYDDLIAHGDKAGASNLLHGAGDSARAHLDELQKKTAQAPVLPGGDSTGLMAAAAGLQAKRLHDIQDEVKAQQQLLDLLSAQISVEGRVGKDTTGKQSNAATAIAKEESARRSEAMKNAAASTLRISEMIVQADRAAANAQLEIQRATIQQRLESDIALADKDKDIKLQANAADIAALNKSGPDYLNQLKSLQEKRREIEQEHASQISELRSKASVEQYQKDLRDLEESERNKIAATEQGSAERLAAIDAALKEQQQKNLQDTQAYRDLLTQRTETVRRMGEDADKLRADAGKEAAEHEQKMGELSLAAQREQQALADSARRMTRQQIIAEETQNAQDEFDIKKKAIEKEAAELDKGAKDYQNKLKALQDKEKELVQAHENEITAIKDKAQMERNQKVLSAEEQYSSEMASSLTQVLMRQKSFASAMASLSDQVASGLMQQAIKHIEMNMLTKQSDAAAAARKGFNAGLQFPFPANLVMGPVLGAAMYARVMAFQDGGIVPGVGRGDVVPAMLEPGEGVVPKGVMEGLSSMARSGGMGGGHHYHVHTRVVLHASALDSGGMDQVLQRHGDKLQKHIESAVRKLNR